MVKYKKLFEFLESTYITKPINRKNRCLSSSILSNKHESDFLPLLETFYFNSLIAESQGIFEPEKTSVYRQAIMKISKDISKNLQYKSAEKNIFNPGRGPLWCSTFIYTNEFKNFPLIDKLQIFVSLADNYNGEPMVSDLRYENRECLKYNPTLEISDDNIFKVCSLIVYVKKEDYMTLLNEPDTYTEQMLIADMSNHIQTIISHELIHLFHCLWCVKYINSSFQANDQQALINDIYQLPEPIKITRMFKSKYISTQELAIFIHQCLYYTQDTEIYAHVETLLSELKNSARNQHVDFYDASDVYRYLQLHSETYRNVMLLYNSGRQLFKEYSKLEDAIHNDLNVDTDEFWKLIQVVQTDKLKVISTDNFKKQLKYWIQQLEKFIKKMFSVAKTYNENPERFI